MGDRTEETKALLRHALLRREASAENDQLQDLFESLCKDIAALTAERDRLAAENAELRQACDDFSKELSVQYQLELEAKCHDDLEKSHAIMVQVVAQRDADLAAANATLDRLREVLAKWMAFDAFNAYDAIGEIRAILNLEDET